MEEDVMRKHIDLYVNNYSLSLGDDGLAAVETLLESIINSHVQLKLLLHLPVCLQAAFPRKFMLHYRPWISELLEFRHPFFYVFQFGIKFFCLQRGIEDAEIGRGIATAACSPLPAAVVGSKVKVKQFCAK